MIVIDRNSIGMVELAWLVAPLAELGHERAAIIIIIITREYLHSIVSAIDNEQETSMMVERQTSRAVERAVSIALIRAAYRELDSSIKSQSSVSHLFHFDLSLSHNDKEMIQAPNCSNQGDEEMKLSLTRDTRHERHERDTKQATSNKKQQEPIDEGTKNSTSLPQPTTPSLTRASS